MKRIFQSTQFYRLLDFMQFAALVISTFNAIVSIIGIFNKAASPSERFAIGGLVALVFGFGFGLIKMQAVNLNRFITSAEESYVISRLIRDGYQHLAILKERGQYDERMYESFRSTSTAFVNSVRNIIQMSVGQNISVCIKIFSLLDGRPPGPDNGSKYQVKTICRSDKNPPERSIDVVITVDQCKALKDIIVARHDHYISTDLDKYNDEASLKSLEPYYDHSETDYSIYYNSIIVVPIRIDMDCNRKDSSYKYLGVLWVDSNSKSAFRNDKFLKHHIEQIKSFADQFSHYLDRFYEYYGSI